jgi:hypothetical protein
MKGFYYFFPEDSDAWRLKNYGCVYLFWPLNVVDQWLGLGRYPASEPLRLSVAETRGVFVKTNPVAASD